ncbi:replication-associated recombination protein A [bacterium]|nr:MAG: replication-associated recombination protein A [bacterium]
MRPETLDEFIGQEHLTGEDGPIRRFLEEGKIPSMIFWGPPGCGKTTLALIIARSIDAYFENLSAVLSGVKDVRAVVERAKDRIKRENKKTVLFIDEIHRFNKAQQDAFLPYVEKGIIVLIGATTENPSFEVIRPLLSRTRVYILYPLLPEHIEILIKRALERDERMKEISPEISDETIKFLAEISGGDARIALDTLEIAAETTGKNGLIDKEIIVNILQRRVPYDKKGEEHYNLISAFIKSVRGSDPDAALYYLARMLEGGEDPVFIARRLVILASEDIGNADPQAIVVAVACKEAVEFVGMPEGFLPLSQATIYLATAPKSNSAYLAYKEAKRAVKEFPDTPVPLHLRNAPTELMEKLGYGKGYRYPHDYKYGVVKQEYLPEELKGRRFYHPKLIGYERKIARYLEWVKEYLNKKGKE